MQQLGKTILSNFQTGSLRPDSGTVPASAAAIAKETNLRRLMRELGSVLVAYSGGVDSSYLALIAAQELGENAAAVTGLSPSVSAFQREEAARIARDHGFEYFTVETAEIENENYRANNTDRCFFCKSELYGKLDFIAREREFSFVADGTNADDLNDHRPGRTAASQAGVRSPLAEVGLSKSEIRELSRRLGLETWDRPASPCLASRVAHGVPVTIGRLRQVEVGEDLLRSYGFREFRVRVHGESVRLEIAKDELSRIFDTGVRESVSSEFRRMGFRYITLDLEGFRSGSMNPK